MIVDDPNGFYPETSTKVFERQIEHIAKHYNVLPLEDIAQRAHRGRSVRGCVAITFDDGFRDNYLNAYPILRRLGLDATIFLTTGYIDSGETPWFIKLRHMFMTTQENRFHFKLGNQEVDMPMETPPQKFACSNVAMTYLKTCPDGERPAALERLRERLKVTVAPEGLMLDWKEIKEMAGNGMSFGAHTVNHPVLSQVTLADAEMEIRASKQRIEQELGMPVLSFAYPFGRRAEFSDRIPPLLRSLGFTCAVTTEPGSNLPGEDLYQLKRSPPWELSLC